MRLAAAPGLSSIDDRAGSPGAFASIEEALEDIAAGRMVVVVDDQNRENEGDLVMAAQLVTPRAINFMTRQAGGWICLALTAARCEDLGLAPMAPTNDSLSQTPFTVTIEARWGVTTGISVRDQAHTMHVAIEPNTGPDDLRIGGHVHPLKARPFGVLERAGHTEAAVDLARLAGLTPAGVICEIQNEDGSMARTPDLFRYCREHGLKMITIADLIDFRQRHDLCVERVVETRMPTSFGDFRAIGYRSLSDDDQHAAFVKGRVEGQDDVLVRIHPKCLVGDVFHSRLCDCGEDLATALEMIEREGRGVVLYLSQEGRGIGLVDQLNVHHRREEGGRLAVDSDSGSGTASDRRDSGIEAHILRDLGLRSMRLLTNRSENGNALEQYELLAAGPAGLRRDKPSKASRHRSWAVESPSERYALGPLLARKRARTQ